MWQLGRLIVVESNCCNFGIPKNFHVGDLESEEDKAIFTLFNTF